MENGLSFYQIMQEQHGASGKESSCLIQETQETRVQTLGWKIPWRKKWQLATHSSILAWKIPWTKKPGGLQSMGLQRVGHD